MKFSKLSQRIVVSFVLAVAVICAGGGGIAYADQKMTITLVLGENGTIGGESYVLTIPDSLTITQDGWNAFDPGINVKANSESSNTFSGKLNVTAASSHDWNLVLSTDATDKDSVSYILAAEEGATENTTTWTFTADEVNATDGTTKTAGVILGEHSGKTAGTYEDTITFTASVGEATTTRTVTFSTANDGKTINKDGVTCNNSFDQFNNLIPGAFSVSSGKFINIVVTANDTSEVGDGVTGWSDNTWTGSASSVQFGYIYGYDENVTIVFTIEE